MSFLNKNFSFDRDENFKEFVESLGIPEEKKELFLKFKPSQSLKKEGDEYIINTSTPDGGSKDIKFKDGVEFDEEVAAGFVAKSKFVVEGNVITQSQSFGDGFSLVYRREYSDDQLVVVITTNKWDGTARRYYKAA